jgi:hypothetical protein
MGREIEAAGDYSVAIALNDQNGAVVSQDNTMAVMGGNVGIGTTSPNATLEVNDVMRLTPRTGSPFACDSTVYGSMYFESISGRLCYCGPAFAPNWYHVDESLGICPPPQ